MIELVVAIFLSSIVVGLVFTTWRSLSNHVYRNERHALLVQAADRIGTAVITEVRRSREVLDAGEGRLRLVAETGDTVAYELTFDSLLLRNETAVHIGVPGGKVAGFTASRAGEETKFSADRRFLLDIALTLVGAAGDSSRVRLQANALAAEAMTGSGWNF